MAKCFGCYSSWTLFLLALLLLSTLLDASDRVSGRGRRRRRNKRGNDKCSSSSVAEYQLTFSGKWSSEKFPRMYPRVRPPAQWSKLVGRTHSPDYHMWTLGENADLALKKFAEDGNSILYDSQPQGYRGIFDSFAAEPITGGQGKTSTFILADGTHSKVSFVVKLVPSPDWFVGVDGLDLCRRGRWRPRARANLRPLDAGTDRGYTFTSPNWASHPPQPVYQINSSYPNHPANSFLYPNYRRLPRIAHVEVRRVSQYFRKGAASSLKRNPGDNLQVVWEDNALSAADSGDMTPLAKSSTTKAVTRDSGAMKTTTLLTTTVTAPMLTTTNGFSQIITERPEHKPDYAAAYSSIHKQLKQRPLMVDWTTTTTTSSTTTTKSPMPVDVADDHPAVHTTTQKMQVKDRNKPPRLIVGAHQHDAEIDSNYKYLPDRSQLKNANELLHDSTTTSAVDAKFKDLHLPKGISIGGNNLNDADMSSSRSSVSMAATTIQGISATPVLTEGPMTISTTQDFISASRDIVHDSSFNSQSLGDHASFESPHTAKVSSAESILSPERTFNSESRSTEKVGTPVMPSFTSSSHLPILSSDSSLVSTTTNGVMKDVRSLFRSRLSASRALKTYPMSTTNGASRSAGHLVRLATTREAPVPTEPAKSQSQHTFDEPQFPEVSVSETYDDESPVDCAVNDWSEWGACSKTCSFGVRTRSRDVLHHSRNGGYACPILQQEVLCGSMRNCRWKHFSILSGKKPSRRLRRRRHHNSNHQKHAQRRRRYYN